MCIEGSLEVSLFEELPAILKGDTVLIPSCIEELTMTPEGNSILLEIHIPD
jgi:hypothetical protein